MINAKEATKISDKVLIKLKEEQFESMLGSIEKEAAQGHKVIIATHLYLEVESKLLSLGFRILHHREFITVGWP